MASLTLTIGSLTASIEANNQKAADVLTQYADFLGAEGTNQERATAVLRALAKHMAQVARNQRGETLLAEARATAQAELDALSWE